MNGVLERKQTMAKSWTVSEVLEGWERHGLAMLDGALSPVVGPRLKQSRYHKSPTSGVNLDLGAWTRVESLRDSEGQKFRDVQIRAAVAYATQTGLTWAKTPDVFHALELNLSRCPYPCEDPEDGPPMPTLPESAVVRHGRASGTGRAIAARAYRARRKG